MGDIGPVLLGIMLDFQIVMDSCSQLEPMNYELCIHVVVCTYIHMNVVHILLAFTKYVYKHQEPR